jgi:hypothetical protein
MPQLGFEPTTPVFERSKTVHALDRAVTVIGTKECYWSKFTSFRKLHATNLRYFIWWCDTNTNAVSANTNVRTGCTH